MKKTYFPTGTEPPPCGQGWWPPKPACPPLLLLSALEPLQDTALILQGSVRRHKKGTLNSTLSSLFLLHRFDEIEMKEEILANRRFGEMPLIHSLKAPPSPLDRQTPVCYECTCDTGTQENMSFPGIAETIPEEPGLHHLLWPLPKKETVTEQKRSLGGSPNGIR